MKTITFLTTILFFLTPIPIQAQVIINEVFPAPEQGNEWIELYNTSNQEIDLNGWLLEDQLSSSSVIAHIENQILLSQSFLVIELSSSKLNNSADGVVLKNSQYEIINQMNYISSKTGLSWAKNDNDIFELTQPTKNAANIFPSPSPSPSPSPITTPSPITAVTTFIATSSPTTITAPISPIFSTPPSPPSTLKTAQQLVLNYDSTASSKQNKFINITTKKLPKKALLSVILGGSWLLFSSSWKIHEKISHHHSTS